jgi:uncharacterized protein (TIGR03083 family)
MPDSPWPTIHEQRGALANDLAGVTEEQWGLPSLCSGWTVHQVLAHQVATAKMSPVTFVGKFAASGFNFTKFSNTALAVEAAGGPAATLAAFRQVQTSTKAPPGPGDTWLGETLVHSEDIRRPLGIAHGYPLAWVTRAIEFYANSNVLIGGKKRVAGLTLKATDTDWSCGTGPVVEGPATSLLLATAGRTVAFDELAGPGLQMLRTR